MFLTKEDKFKNFFLIWLICLLLLVSLIIIVGGLTRITNSGLSITEWDLFSGIFPPSNSEEWEKFFNLYKQIPQYNLINYNMTIHEFKYIFLWEYYHRLLGRVIGVFFLIPFIYFCYKKIIKKKYLIKLSLVFLLIVLQGVVGWYMVKSGLVDDVTVSHYRLSTHLLIAFIILSSIFWIFLNCIGKQDKIFFNSHNSNILIKFYIFLLFLQIIFGAFVSGLDAGKIYQTWPLMNESYFPSDVIIKNVNDFFDFSNQSLVQFIHRNIAYLTFCIILFIGYFIFKNNKKNLYLPFFVVFFIINIQIILGISVLLSNTHSAVASLHQISSIFLILFSLKLYHMASV
jgi:heme a synthase